jgi:hypothetical protein
MIAPLAAARGTAGIAADPAGAPTASAELRDQAQRRAGANRCRAGRAPGAAVAMPPLRGGVAC